MVAQYFFFLVQKQIYTSFYLCVFFPLDVFIYEMEESST